LIANSQVKSQKLEVRTIIITWSLTAPNYLLPIAYCLLPLITIQPI
jgi:hypothetical protein